MSPERRVLNGIVASAGIGLGVVVVFDRRTVPVVRRSVAAHAIDAEVARLTRAVHLARREVEEICDGLSEQAGGDHRLLLQTQLMMLDDELLFGAATEAVRARGINSEWALRTTVDSVCARLRAAPEPYFRERAEDVRQVGEQVLRLLTGARGRSMPDLPEPAVLVASQLTPAEAAKLTAGKLLALVTDSGSATSHTAILARALRIPSVVGVVDVTHLVSPGDEVIVDALHGEIILHAGAEERGRARARAARFTSFTERLRGAREAAARTVDGVQVSLHANVELERDVGMARSEEVDGIGLYRTEFLYLDRDAPPTEAEQTEVYRRVARRLGTRPVVFRTFDLGADKMPGDMQAGPNPALGLRALRLAFEQPELLVTQLRALLRAATLGNVRLMFPMVSSVVDLRRALVLLDRARRDLDAEGAAYGPVAVGTMLEVPAAVLVADRLAPHCDFFSLGTNDLTQYTLALDRSNPRVAHLASALDPAVLRLLSRAREVAAQYELPVNICGDVAADPVATPLLLGLGFTTLSMPTAALPLISEVVRRLDHDETAAAASRALDLDSVAAVERLVVERFGARLSDLWEEQGIELPR